MIRGLSSARVAVVSGLLVAIVLRVGQGVASSGDAGAGDVGVAVGGSADAARSVSSQAVTEAKAALAGNPSRRDTARAAFERAMTVDDDAMAATEAYFRLGVLEEEDGDFVRALALQRACMTKGPTSSFARSARLRIGWISARSEGDFAPLARLQRVRRDPALLNDPAAIQSLAVDAEAFPPGRVRAEARMVVAGAWLNRMNQREAAIGELRKVADDPSSDSMDGTIAHRHLVETFLADGRLDEAESEVQSHPFDPQLGAQVRRRLRHRMLRRVAILELVGFFGLAGVRIAGVRARRAGGPLRRAENARRASARGAFAVGFALLCCVSVVAAVFVCLDAINAKYLASFGL